MDEATKTCKLFLTRNVVEGCAVLSYRLSSLTSAACSRIRNSILDSIIFVSGFVMARNLTPMMLLLSGVKTPTIYIPIVRLSRKVVSYKIAICCSVALLFVRVSCKNRSSRCCKLPCSLLETASVCKGKSTLLTPMCVLVCVRPTCAEWRKDTWKLDFKKVVEDRNVHQMCGRQTHLSLVLWSGRTSCCREPCGHGANQGPLELWLPWTKLKAKFFAVFACLFLMCPIRPCNCRKIVSSGNFLAIWSLLVVLLAVRIVRSLIQCGLIRTLQRLVCRSWEVYFWSWWCLPGT